MLFAECVCTTMPDLALPNVLTNEAAGPRDSPRMLPNRPRLFSGNAPISKPGQSYLTFVVDLALYANSRKSRMPQAPLVWFQPDGNMPRDSSKTVSVSNRKPPAKTRTQLTGVFRRRQSSCVQQNSPRIALNGESRCVLGAAEFSRRGFLRVWVGDLRFTLRTMSQNAEECSFFCRFTVSAVDSPDPHEQWTLYPSRAFL